MTYSIKEMFYTLQGEGFHSGRPAVFCRFTGCNLWSGREQDRATSICRFCDTDFVGTDGLNGGKFITPESLAEAINAFWPTNGSRKFVVFTGGEPALQLDEDLLAAMHKFDFECAVESNGTLALPKSLDWVCISPKGNSKVIVQKCDELKVVFPQIDNSPSDYSDIEARYRFLSPINDWKINTITPTQNSATAECVDYCLKNPDWSLTLQSHKIINID